VGGANDGNTDTPRVLEKALDLAAAERIFIVDF
jgi:hypothetical protein